MSFSSDPAIRPFDVAVVDRDLLWRVEYMNLCNANDIYAEDFGTVLDGFSATLPGRTTIVLIGPDALDDAHRDLAEARRRHPTAHPIVLAGTEATRQQISEALGGVEVFARDTAAEVLIARFAEILGVGREREARSDEQGAVTTATWVPSVPIVVVTAAKSGEGATTLAMNLAAAYARRGSLRVALVDGDPLFGDLALLGGFPTSEAPGSDVDVTRIVLGPDRVLHRGHRDETTGVLCVLPPLDMADREVEPRIMVELLAALEEHADLIVIDAPFEVAFEGDLLINAAQVLLVTAPRTASLKNALIAARYFGRDRRVHLVVNHLGDQRGRTRGEIEHALGVHVLAMLPHDGKIDDHPGFEHLAVLAHPRSEYTKALDALIDRLQLPFDGATQRRGAG